VKNNNTPVTLQDLQKRCRENMCLEFWFKHS